MTVNKLGNDLKSHWPEIGTRLLGGSYDLQPVQRVKRPKSSGGIPLLGVPTVLGRFILQAVQRAQDHIRAGYGAVVDLDLGNSSIR